jgi:hypothetical protein
MITYKGLGIYEVLSLVSGELLVDEVFLIEALDENPDYKKFVIECSKGRLTYKETAKKIAEII